MGMGKTLSDSDLGEHVLGLWPEQVSQALQAVQKEPRVLPSCVKVYHETSLCLGRALTLPPFWLVIFQHSHHLAPGKEREPGQ